MGWFNGNLRLGIEPGFEALPLDVAQIGNPFPASANHAQAKVLRQRWTEAAEAPSLIEHEDVQAASVAFQSFRIVNAIVLTFSPSVGFRRKLHRASAQFLNCPFQAFGVDRHFLPE